MSLSTTIRVCSALIISVTVTVLLSSAVHAADEIEDQVAASPKAPWGEFEVVEERDPHWATQVLLWLPNRVADLFDVFKLDLGVGSAIGLNVRASEYVQVGGRAMLPVSHRIGILGRRAPYLRETEAEYGVSPYYIPSPDRSVCKGELGAGIDFFLISGYAGICVDELYDFFGGMFLYDVKNDDWEW